MARQGILFVLSGPSGAGKGTICQELLRIQQHNLHYSISATTRPARNGEKNGVNYWFVSHEKFKNMIDNDELLEYAEVYGNYYGTQRYYVTELLKNGQDVVLEIDIQGAMQIKNKFPEGVFIYIVPPSLNELADRIYKRGTDSLESIKNRLSCAGSELTYAKEYNYIVVNDVVSQAVVDIQGIIAAEKCKTERKLYLIDTMLNEAK